MAEKLSITVALEGGKEIMRQLEGIGDAGKAAFEDIAKSAEKVGGFKNLKPEEVTAKLKQLGIVGTDAFIRIKAAVENASRMERVVVGIQNIENAFARVGTAAATLATRFGPIAIAAVLAGKQIAESMVDAAKAIGEVNAAALKVGVSIEKFDALRLAMEKAGLSGKEVGAGITQIQSAFDKVNVDKVATALRQLEEAGTRGFGVVGTAQLKLLNEEAAKIGPAGDAARAALQKLGQPIPAGPAEALKKLGIEATNAADFAQKLMEKLQQMPDSTERTRLAIAGLGDVVGPKFIAFLQNGGTAVDLFVEKQRALTTETAKTASEVEQAQNRFATAWTRFLTDPSLANFTAAASAAFVNLGTQINQAIAPLIEASNKLDAAVWEAFKSAGTAAMDAISSAINGTIGVINALIDAIGNAINALLNLLGLGQQVGGGSGENPVTEPQGFARGGHVGGRGSGMSDSNLAWVSRGEHIMPAHAVRQPGVLAFLEALRRSGGDLRRVLDGMGRFALGGMVPRAMPALPALAGGGGNAAHRDLGTVRLVMPDGVMVSGLADAKIVEALGRAAAKAQIRSGGRKPSRYS